MQRGVTILGLVLLLLPLLTDCWSITAKQPSDRCPDSWTPSGDSCYKVFIFDRLNDVTPGGGQTVAPPGSRTWKQARLSCMMLGSDLVSVNSEREAYQVDNVRRSGGVDDTHYFWVGLHDATSEGNFRWVDGSNITYSQWKVGEPTSSVPQNPRGPVENYVVSRGGVGWLDVENTWIRHTNCVEPYAYICEKSVKSSPDSEARRRITRILGLAGSSGAKGDQGPKGDPGTPGVPGQPGQLGPRGHSGRPGAYGQKGERGAAGQVGRTGPEGPEGPPGMIQVMDTLIGPHGAPGERGPRGPEGLPGPRGVPGAKGGRGFDGPTGPAGPKGSTGALGHTGKHGMPGPRGVSGPPGPTGTPGLTGKPGVRGQTGEKGQRGLTGDKGDRGLPGVAGLDGASGATGPRGMRGPMGVQGLTGGTGPKGQQGQVGQKGQTGEAGPRGSEGNSGEQGLPGLDGLPGIPGAMGPEGPQGPQGGPGRDGRNGIPGMPGLDGEPGQKGDLGRAGPRGHSGPPGPPGPVPANAASGTVRGASSYHDTRHRDATHHKKTIFVNATAFCRGRSAAAYTHPLHCWQFITCGALYGGDMEHTCYSGRRFVASGPECKKDHTCFYGAPASLNKDSNGDKKLAALALKEGDNRFARRSIVEKLRATQSVYSAGMVVVFVLIAALAALVCRQQLAHKRPLVPPLIIEKPGSVI